MKILAIETSGEACSAALLIENESQEVHCAQAYELAPRKHGEKILPMVKQLLSDAQLTLASLDAVAFGRGPGSFIGVRIAASVTQGLAYAADLPVVPVSSLAALAYTLSPGYVICAIDARMHEIYWGAYAISAPGDITTVQPESVQAPQSINPEFIRPGDSWRGIGNAWKIYPEHMPALLASLAPTENTQVWPQAEHVARIAIKEFRAGRSVNAQSALPVYVRNHVADKPKGEGVA